VHAGDRSRAGPVGGKATRPTATATASAGPHPAARLLALQRAAGNRAAGRLLQRSPWWYDWAAEQASALRDYLTPPAEATAAGADPASAAKPAGRSTTRIPKALRPEDLGTAPGVTKSVTDGTPYLTYEDELVGGDGWAQVAASPGVELVPGKADKQWALPAVAGDLKRIGAVWQARHPEHPIRVLDVSKRGGGPLENGSGGFHASHQTGVDMDIGFMRTDANRRRGVRFDNPASNYSRDLTEELLDTFIAESTVGVEYIFFADPFVEQYGRIGSSKKSNASHTKHVHVRFRDPYGEALPSWLE
jgi:hypothetical protein